MNKHIKLIAVAVLLITTTILTRAQNISTNTTSTESKFTDIVEVSFAGIPVGADVDNNRVSVGFRNVFAYNLNNHYSIGVGIGYESNSNSNNISYLPLSADLRWYITQNKVAPFLNLNGGYAFNLDKGETYGGGNEIFTGLNVGIRVTTKSNIGLEFALGLKYEGYYYNYPVPTNTEGVIRYASNFKDYLYIPFTFGFVF